jgi:UDP-N-acetylmuramate--alanine ligase
LLHPQISVVTNIEMEHCDFYASMDDVYKSFARFVDGQRPGGRLILQGDHPNTEAFLKRIPARRIDTFGLDPKHCTLWARDIRYAKGKLRFSVFEYDRSLGEIEMKVIGKHNVLNALAALSVVLREGVPLIRLLQPLPNFLAQKSVFSWWGRPKTYWLSKIMRTIPPKCLPPWKAPSRLISAALCVCFSPIGLVACRLCEPSFEIALPLPTK